MQTGQFSNMQKNTPLNKDVEIPQEAKDCVEVSVRTGLSVDYVRKVIIYNKRYSELIWSEYAKLLKERQDAIDRVKTNIYK